MTSTRPREGRGVRHAAGGEHDRLKRAVLQPVQCWDKKWAESKNGKQLLVFKWVKSDRQVDFDDDDDDDEIEQAPIPRQVEEEVGTPAPPLPTLQDADDTGASTPAQTGEDDDEDDAISTTTTTTTTTTNTTKPIPSNPPATHTSTSPTLSKTEKRPSLTSSTLAGSNDNISSHPETLAQKLIREESRGQNNSSSNTTTASTEDDDEDDTDSSRPLVFTPSLETPVETQANTPQDFESMSPAPMMMDSDDIPRDAAEVEMVVKGLDEGQAEMEEEMEEKVVVKEKEQQHQHSSQPISGASATSAIVEAEHEHPLDTSRARDVDDTQMEIDTPSVPLP